MAYTGQPVPSSVHNIGYGKISDGKSVKVTVPVSTKVEAGKFYLLDDFLGVAFQSVQTGSGQTAEVVLNIEQAEYQTTKVASNKTFTVGQIVYWDGAAFTSDEKKTDTTPNRVAGRCTSWDETKKVLTFILAPQAYSVVQIVQTVQTDGG